jgi:hypothetical protein
VNIQTSQIWISQKTYDSFYKNWTSNESENPDPDILDSGMNSPKRSFEITLRIPMELRGTNGYMLIKAKLLFLKNKNKVITLAIVCSFTKPLILSLFIGFLISLVFTIPFCYFSLGTYFIVSFFAGLAIAAVYFARFYYNIKKISDPYIIALERKYLDLASNN